MGIPILRWMCLTVFLLAAAAAQAQKTGGILRTVTFQNPPSLSIHDEATTANTWPMLPVFNNLVFYNPSVPGLETADDLVGELAESWHWSDGGTRLTFKLRRGVTWHDGKPFTSADVKHTYDVVRGASEKKLKLNPRKGWYANVKEIVAAGEYEVAFVLTQPQPSLLAMLATGYSPVYPAHLDPQELRTRAVGTGPFRLKELVPDQTITLERNPKYFVKGRPYLDGIIYYVMTSRSARNAALMANQLDAWMPTEGTVNFRDQVLAQVPGIVVQEVTTNVSDNIVWNPKRPPFDNPKAREAVNRALDRKAFIKSVLLGAGKPGGAILPPPYGPWGLPVSALRDLPGFGDAATEKTTARRLLAEAGFGPGNPLKLTVSTRSFDAYRDSAVFVVSELRSVGIEATLEEVETTAWFARLAKRDYQVAVNITGIGAADPDANFLENYICGSQRNYTDYCNAELEKKIDASSRELDPKKRLGLVWQIDRQLQMDSARPILSHRLAYFLHWPYVKGLVAKNTLFNYSRMQDVWMDR